MRSARKSVVTFLSVTMMSIWIIGCGPTNGLPPLTGEFLYVSNAADGVVSEFSINTGTGQLSFLSQFNAESGANLRGIAIHPSNEFLFVDAANLDNVVSLDIGDGSYSGLVFLSNGTEPTANSPTGIAADPEGLCVYATNAGSASFSSYRLNSDGVMTPFTSEGTGGAGPLGVAVTPDSLRLLVVNHGGPSLTTFFYPVSHKVLPCSFPQSQTIGLATTDAAAAVNSTPEYVVVHPTLANAYVTDDGLGQVDEIALGQPGLLSGITGFSLLGAVKPNPAGDLQPAPYSIVMHPSGNFLYTGSVTNGIISEFSIDPTTGLLTSQSDEVGVSSPISLAIDASGKYLYAANAATSELTMFSIDPLTGGLAPIGETNTIAAENPPNPASSPFSIVATH
jgi:6-phosphogluconolactonase (cycloisomerase 2 family)